MKLDEAACRRRLSESRSAYLATVGVDLQPHVVPVTYAVDGDEIVIGIDQKPKTTTNLKRLRNIVENPRVTVLCDEYDDDWTKLWWVRADGHATVVTEGDRWESAIDLLRARYPQYETDPPRGPVIVTRVDRWSGWSYAWIADPGRRGVNTPTRGGSTPANHDASNTA